MQHCYINQIFNISSWLHYSLHIFRNGFRCAICLALKILIFAALFIDQLKVHQTHVRCHNIQLHSDPKSRYFCCSAIRIFIFWQFCTTKVVSQFLYIISSQLFLNLMLKCPMPWDKRRKSTAQSI